LKVVHKQTGAIMVLKSLYRMDQRGEANFLQEAAFMRNLCHPNVLAILGVLYKDKKLHIVSEYISCGSLRACLEAKVHLSWLQKLHITKDVAAGMVLLIFLGGKRNQTYAWYADLPTFQTNHSPRLDQFQHFAKRSKYLFLIYILVFRFTFSQKYGDAVVADFGLALMLPRRLSRKRRIPVGDPYVMAPEMIRVPD